MATNNPTTEKMNPFPWLIMSLMSSVTFVGILSELMPSGVLPQMMDELNINEIQGGNLVGYYAIASAIFSIPLVSLTMQYNRKALLLVLLIGFAVSNVVAGIVQSYAVITVMRVIGGICAGVMWPMIAAYAMRLVHEDYHGKAIAVTMAGNTLGISVGMPLLTFVGNEFGWRVEFVTLGVFIGVIALLSVLILPSTPGEKLTKSSSPFALLKIPSIWLILGLTLLGVGAHYSVYVYVTSLVEEIRLSGGIESALSLFGVGSLVSVLLAVKYTDDYLRGLTIAMFGLLTLSMLVFMLFRGMPVVSHFAFFLWGLSFGPLVTLLQAAVSRQVESAKDIATSLQSCTFNLSIMIATSVAGLLLGVYSAMSLPVLAIVLAIPGMAVAILARKTLS